MAVIRFLLGAIVAERGAVLRARLGCALILEHDLFGERAQGAELRQSHTYTQQITSILLPVRHDIHRLRLRYVPAVLAHARKGKSRLRRQLLRLPLTTRSAPRVVCGVIDDIARISVLRGPCHSCGVVRRIAWIDELWIY